MGVRIVKQILWVCTAKEACRCKHLILTKLTLRQLHPFAPSSCLGVKVTLTMTDISFSLLISLTNWFLCRRTWFIVLGWIKCGATVCQCMETPVETWGGSWATASGHYYLWLFIIICTLLLFIITFWFTWWRLYDHLWHDKSIINDYLMILDNYFLNIFQYLIIVFKLLFYYYKIFVDYLWLFDDIRSLLGIKVMIIFDHLLIFVAYLMNIP